ncbi:4Fe-4S dicluster domain-containing protein [Alkaliphilus metalliredigens]|nr:4Fe-4S dicluster domain-containing protein [Alkaliphilus metalliredigens]
MTGIIVADIKARKHRQGPASIGARALTSIVSKLPNNGKGALKYIVNEQCKQCGTCVKVCPTQNIEVANKVQFSDHCTSCYGCLHL